MEKVKSALIDPIIDRLLTISPKVLVLKVAENIPTHLRCVTSLLFGSIRRKK